jgi:hypothetical protein
MAGKRKWAASESNHQVYSEVVVSTLRRDALK